MDRQLAWHDRTRATWIWSAIRDVKGRFEMLFSRTLDFTGKPVETSGETGGSVNAGLRTTQFIALCLLVVATPLSYWPIANWLSFPFYDVLVATIIGPLFLASLILPRLAMPAIGRLEIVALSFLAWVGLSAITKGSWSAASPLVNLILLLLFITQSHLSIAQLKGLVVAMVLTGALVAGFGVYQWIVEQKLPVFATLVQQNNYSGYLCALLPMSLCLWTCRSRFLNWVGVAVTTALVFGMALSMTRAGYIASIVGMLGFAFVKDRRLLIVVLAYVVFFGTGIGEVRARFVRIDALPKAAQDWYSSRGQTDKRDFGGDTSMSCRIYLWRLAWWEFEKEPLTGIGIGNYHRSLDRYRQENPQVRDIVTMVISEPHNSYIKVLCELGLPGLALFLLFLGTWGWKCGRHVFAVERKRVDGWALALFWGLVTFLIHNLTNTLFILVPCALGFWVALGVLNKLTSKPA